MTFEYEDRQSRSRFVDVIWRTHDTSDGTYLAAADACWDMIFIRSVHGNRVLLSGPSSQTTPVPYRAGNRNVGIRFHRGTFLTHVPASVMVDTTDALSMPTDDTFILAGLDWSMPTFETADEFIADLERLQLLSDDPVAMAALRGEEAATVDGLTSRWGHGRLLRPGLMARWRHPVPRHQHRAAESAGLSASGGECP